MLGRGVRVLGSLCSVGHGPRTTHVFDLLVVERCQLVSLPRYALTVDHKRGTSTYQDQWRVHAMNRLFNKEEQNRGTVVTQNRAVKTCCGRG